jgi:hypothetical protein
MVCDEEISISVPIEFLAICDKKYAKMADYFSDVRHYGLIMSGLI